MSKQHEIMVTNHFMNVKNTLVIFKISDITQGISDEINSLNLGKFEIYQANFDSGIQIVISRGQDEEILESLGSYQETKMNDCKPTF